MSGLDLKFELLFPYELIVEFANKMLADAGQSVRAVDAAAVHHNYYVFQSLAGNGRAVTLYAPICEFDTGVISFRSILQKAGSLPRWLTNGQASSDCRELVFHGEQGPKLIASRDALAAYMRSGKPEAYRSPDLYLQNVETRLSEYLARGWYGEDYVIVSEGKKEILPHDRSPSMVF